MDIEVLEKVNLLPPDKQIEVKDFVEYLLSKYKNTNQDTLSVADIRRNNAGRLKGQIWMSDDFNETPDDFKDYL